jgi:hypothetical protein
MEWTLYTAVADIVVAETEVSVSEGRGCLAAEFLGVGVSGERLVTAVVLPGSFPPPLPAVFLCWNS